MRSFLSIVKAGGASEDPTVHYVRMTTQLVNVQRKWGGFVQLAIALSVLPNWHHVGIVGLTLFLVPFNYLTSVKLEPRLGPIGTEAVRTLVNLSVSCVAYHAMDWPVAAFLWLPYTALASDGTNRRLAYGVLAVHSTAYTILSIADHVTWERSFAWIAIAVCCRVFTDRRVAIARELWLSSHHAHEELKQEVAARLRIEIELRQAQKLEAMGRLAAGVAHEINNPLQFVDNGAQLVAEGIEEIGEDVEPALRAELLESLAMMQEGVKRVTAIVRAMKDFVPPSRSGKTPTNLRREIEATLIVARHEYANVADVKTELGELPLIACHPGAIAQVVLNLVVNASHAIAARTDKGRGTITLRATTEDGAAIISVTDDGIGIPDDVRDRIFEPFFTTKPVGTGTGQGLAIARSIVEAHDGRLGFESAIGRGTTFTLRLPIPPALSAPTTMKEAA